MRHFDTIPGASRRRRISLTRYFNNPYHDNRVPPDAAAFIVRDMVRSACIATLASSVAVFLLVAVQYFDASSTLKGLLSGSLLIGLIVVPFVISFLSTLKIKTPAALSLLYALSSLCFIPMSFVESLEWFTALYMLAMTLAAAGVPLVTSLWHHHVDATIRGKYFGSSMMVGYSVGVLVGLGCSAILEYDLALYWCLPLFYSLLLAVASWVCFGIDSEVKLRRAVNPLGRLSLLWKNKLFGYLCLVWSIFGFANLAVFPLRTEYLAHADYKLVYSPFTVLLLVEILPGIARIGSVPFWGRIFDRANFIFLRMGINLLLSLSIILFFVPNLYLQYLSAVIFGLGTGGGRVAWHLWVTKYVPAEETADYMSVHLFLTGIRGTVAPLVAYACLEGYSISSVTLLCALACMLTIGMLFPVRKFG